MPRSLDLTSGYPGPGREGNDDYSQAGDLFRLMTPAEQARLIGNIVASIRTVPRDIQTRQIQHFFKADPKYGQVVVETRRVEKTVGTQKQEWERSLNQTLTELNH